MEYLASSIWIKSLFISFIISVLTIKLSLIIINKTKTIEKSSFPNAEMIKMNNVIEIDTKDHENKKTTSLAIIKEINKETVVLDLNHPLAGIPIEFKVKIVNIYE